MFRIVKLGKFLNMVEKCLSYLVILSGVTYTFVLSCLFVCFNSTNGTVINKLQVVKKQTYPLQSGDIIYLVYRKNEPEHSKRDS